MNTRMKTTNVIRAVLVGAVLLAPAAVRAEEFVTNRLTFSARFGFNISAKFKGATTLPLPANTRTTPRGDLYNYDDGYALTDSSGNLGGQTWYWGYDNSASQISGDNILLSRSTPNREFTSPSLQSDPTLGCELVYNRLLLVKGNVRFGLEAAVNFLNISLGDSRTFSGTASRMTDAYPFTPGTTPPAATPSSPYQGSFQGPGFIIGTNFTSSTTTVPGGALVTGRRKFEANVWGSRVGPYADFPLGTNFNLWISGGVALGWLLSDASWSETITLGAASEASSGSGRHDGFLWGGYVAANVSWDVKDRWSVVGGVQYQNLGVYRHNFGARQAEVDLSNSIFVTIGLSRRF